MSDSAARRARITAGALDAAVAVARAHGVRVDAPVVLNDLFSVVVHLAPAPIVARVPTWISRLRTPVEDWMRREIAVATHLRAGDPARRGAAAGPLLEPADEVVLHGDAHPGNVIATRAGLVWIDFEDVCRGPREWDYATTGGEGAPGPYAQLRSLQVALCLAILRDDFADVDGWDAGIDHFIDAL